MSIEIDWDALTSGPKGAELAEFVRSFVHEKFQQIPLPRFIRAVQVQSFEFGDVCPKVVLKDLSDPFPDFYEDDDEDEDDDDEDDAKEPKVRSEPKAVFSHGVLGKLSAHEQDARDTTRQSESQGIAPTEVRENKPPPSSLKLLMPGLPSSVSLADHIASPLLLSRSSTPGIPGGTSNLSYFQLPLANRMHGSAAPTPMSAVRGWQEHQARYQSQAQQQHLGTMQHATGLEHHGQSYHSPAAASASHPDPSTRPSTAHSHATHLQDANQGVHGVGSPRSPSPTRDPDPNDFQVVFHISYKGNVRLSLTAEILLDYPMTSFVGIPFKLNIVGLDFDGVGVLALLNLSKSQSEEGEEGDRRAHFCFLSPEDAETLIGAESVLNQDTDEAPISGVDSDQRQKPAEPKEHGDKLGGLLRGIRVESEIGKTKDGKQNLKNVGKVENFILEQVRRIFEDEFVFPSFWTFLV